MHLMKTTPITQEFGVQLKHSTVSINSFNSTIMENQERTLEQISGVKKKLNSSVHRVPLILSELEFPVVVKTFAQALPMTAIAAPIFSVPMR